MEDVGLNNISNTFHEFGEAQGAGGIVSGIMDIVGNVGQSCLWEIMENYGFTNISNSTLSMNWEKPREQLHSKP